MGDAGEGLIDADARIQERMDELAMSRAKGRATANGRPGRRSQNGGRPGRSPAFRLLVERQTLSV